MSARRPGARPLTRADVDLWAWATRDVARLRAVPRGAEPGKSAPQPPPTDDAGRAALADALEQAAHRHAVPGRPARPAPPAGPGGVDRVTLRRLQRGDLPVARKLDLHGMTQTEAHAALAAAVERAQAEGGRALLVVTGKGRGGEGVLKGAVPRWLGEPPLAARVRGVAPAGPRHGGAGALYVLVRRRRETRPGE